MIGLAYISDLRCLINLIATALERIQITAFKDNKKIRAPVAEVCGLRIIRGCIRNRSVFCGWGSSADGGTVHYMADAEIRGFYSIVFHVMISHSQRLKSFKSNIIFSKRLLAVRYWVLLHIYKMENVDADYPRMGMAIISADVDHPRMERLRMRIIRELNIIESGHLWPVGIWIPK